MAHLVETMAYVGETPWHGLGNQLTPKQPLNVWAKQAGMDWQIVESPVCFMTGKAGHLGGIKSFDDHKVLFRSDNKTPLSVVSALQGRAARARSSSSTATSRKISGFELETAGVLKGGRKVWALARTGQSGALKGDDVTNGYVLLATACDGTLATTAQFTSVRVVCNNTLSIALDGKSNAVKVPHSTTFDPQAVKKQLGICVSAWDDVYVPAESAQRTQGQTAGSAELFLRVFSDDSKPGTIQTSERLMTRTLELFDGKGMGADLASSKGTAFGLLNAVTQYVDHERRARNVDNRLDSAWFGHGADVKQKALDHALAMVA
jgi:phage/plasmid-like protein (TIGR03299 family)